MTLLMANALKGIPVAMTEQEWQTRCDLAAAYRLAAHFGWDDLIGTHMSARVRGTTDQFLINPFGMMFDEITASSLVKVNLAGDILQVSEHPVNRAGFIIHSAVHEARHDVECVIHLHTRDGVAVSATEAGLLPLNQSAMLIRARTARHAYEGVATNEAERVRIVADLGTQSAMFLDNHGTLAVGGTVAEAFYNMYQLEWACTTQVRTLSMGLPVLHAAADVTHATESLFVDQHAEIEMLTQALLWPALLRKLQRVNPGYDS